MDELILLAEYEVLTADQVQRLRDPGIGIHTLNDLTGRTRNHARRRLLEAETGIPQERLLAAGAAANLLALKGPGAYIAERFVATTDWEGSDLQDDDIQKWLEQRVSADRQGLLEWLASDNSVQADAPGSRRSSQSFRRLWLLTGIGLLALLVWYGLHERSRLFPSAVEDIGRQIAQSLERSLVILEISIVALFLVGGILSIALVMRGSNALFGKMSDKVSQRIMSNRDRLVVAEAMLRLPPWARRTYEMTDRTPEVLMVVSLLVIGAIVFLDLFEYESQLLAVTVVVGVGGLVMLLCWLPTIGFRRLNAGWAGQVRAHVSADLVMRVLVSTISIVVGILLWAGVFFDVGVPAIQRWTIERAEQSEFNFHSAIDQFISDSEIRNEWHAGGRNRVLAWSEAITDSVQIGTDDRSQLFQAGVIGFLGVLFGVAMVEFLYVNQRKGLVVLLIWFAFFLTSELGPDWIDQWLSSTPAVTQISIIALGTSLIVTVVGEFAGETVERQDQRECPNPDCYFLIDSDDSYCRKCGTPIVISPP